jgi:hypothetical protein
MLNVIMLSVVMLSVIMLSVIMLSIIMLSVIMLNAVAPFTALSTPYLSRVTVQKKKAFNIATSKYNIEQN